MESPTPHPGVATGAPPAPGPVSADANSPHELESRLGHQFSRREFLVQSLTHRSLAYEQGIPADGMREDNERLEFLGDAVVGLVTAESLYDRYPGLSEGSLTRLRGALVSRRHLASVAETLELGQELRLGRGE